MGGRLLPAKDGPAAQLMYENGKGDRLTLYFRVGIGGQTAFGYHEDRGIGAFYWTEEGFGYAIAGKADSVVAPGGGDGLPADLSGRRRSQATACTREGRLTFEHGWMVAHENFTGTQASDYRPGFSLTASRQPHGAAPVRASRNFLPE
jgi:hypothetical protein